MLKFKEGKGRIIYLSYGKQIPKEYVWWVCNVKA